VSTDTKKKSSCGAEPPLFSNIIHVSFDISVLTCRRAAQRLDDAMFSIYVCVHVFVRSRRALAHIRLQIYPHTSIYLNV